MLKTKYLWALALLFVFAACEDDKYEKEIEPPIEVVSGEADFTNYVSVGNSLTAGIADGALFIASQTNAFPNLLAEKMALAGGGEFTTPWMNDNTGGLLLAGNPIPGPFGPRLYFDGCGLSVLPKTPTTDVTDIHPGPYNNMGVPGAKTFHLLYDGYGDISNLALGSANPYYVRMASSPNAFVLQDAMAANPTFFSLLIGSNDVLGYATSGGDGTDPITPKAEFDFYFATILGGLTSTGAKGVVGNIPNVLYSPFFTTVPYAPLDPTPYNPDDPCDAPSAYPGLIDTLNEAYALLNQAFAGLGYPERSVVFSKTEASPIVIHDESIDNIQAGLFVILEPYLGAQQAAILSAQYGQSRQANESDLVLLTSQTVIGELNMEYFQYLVGLGVPQEMAGQLSVNGLTYPMSDEWILLSSEQDEIIEATAMFNATIEQLTANSGMSLFDAEALLEEIALSGYSSDGFTLTADLIFGGFFSLDGLHYTARGGSVVANEIMKVIDVTYESNFEEASALYDIGEFPVIYSPALP